MIRSLQSALNVTSVVVTHDLKSAFTVGDRLAFLNDGKMSFVGTLDEAHHASDPELKEFLRVGSTGAIA